MSFNKMFGLEKVFCKVCDTRLVNNPAGRLVGIEFSDGWYCVDCGKQKRTAKQRNKK